MKLEEIDTSTTAGKRRVMELAEQGRKIAYCVRPAGPHAWHEHAKWGEPDWDWLHIDYAIIAEPAGPREVWGVVFPKHLGLWEEMNAAAEHAEKAGYELVRYIRADLAGEVK